jgi:hypothetical protein
MMYGSDSSVERAEPGWSHATDRYLREADVTIGADGFSCTRPDEVGAGARRVQAR